MIPKTNSENYLLSESPVPWTILGRRLRPFSIGHWVALQRWDCWPPRSDDQYVLSLVFCSMRWEQIERWVGSSIKGLATLFWMGLKLRRISILQKLKVWKTFDLYLSEHFFEPSYIATADGGACSLPAPLHIKVRLIRDFGMSEGAVMDYPLRRAMFLLRADQEARGMITVIDSAAMREAAFGWRESRLQFDRENGGKN